MGKLDSPGAALDEQACSPKSLTSAGLTGTMVLKRSTALTSACARSDMTTSSVRSSKCVGLRGKEKASSLTPEAKDFIQFRLFGDRFRQEKDRRQRLRRSRTAEPRLYDKRKAAVSELSEDFTFTPSISPEAHRQAKEWMSANGNKPRWEVLSCDSERLERKKKAVQKRADRELKGCTFSPSINKKSQALVNRGLFAATRVEHRRPKDSSPSSGRLLRSVSWGPSNNRLSTVGEEGEETDEDRSLLSERQVLGEEEQQREGKEEDLSLLAEPLDLGSPALAESESKEASLLQEISLPVDPLPDGAW